MPDLQAGSVITTEDTPPTQAATATASYDLTSTTYTTASTGGSYADCAVVFTAPTTGRVKISIAARFINSSTPGTMLSSETREGAVIGAGTVVEDAADGRGTYHYGATFARQGISHLLTGLTPGATYNTRLLHRVSAASTGSIALRELIVEPVT